MLVIHVQFSKQLIEFLLDNLMFIGLLFISIYSRNLSSHILCLLMYLEKKNSLSSTRIPIRISSSNACLENIYWACYLQISQFFFFWINERQKGDQVLVVSITILVLFAPSRILAIHLNFPWHVTYCWIHLSFCQSWENETWIWHESSNVRLDEPEYVDFLRAVTTVRD